MKLSLTTTAIGIFILITSCTSNRYVQNEYVSRTPNGIAINETLICDQTEISNFHWLEYRQWTKNTFGENSEEYKSTMPDTNVLMAIKEFRNYKDLYFRHPVFRDYPIVGISQKQAENYSQWRSDRVFENILIRDGVLQFNTNPTRENHFTIAKYFEGDYYQKVGDSADYRLEKVIPDMSRAYPVFKLPDTKERLMVLDYVDSTDHLFHSERPKKYHKWREENLPFQLAIARADSALQVPYRNIDSNPDKHDRYRLILDSRGNVAEWGAETNITYGGGWPHNVEYIMANDAVNSNNVNAWTGFRNVCTWRRWE